MKKGDYEEARKCWKCKQYGKLDKTIPCENKADGKVEIFVCESQTCPKFEETWIVQVLPDGTIPERTLGDAKEFPPLTPDQEAFARRQIEEIQLADPTIPRNF